MAGVIPPNAPVADGPPTDGFAIVPSDTVPLPFLTRGIYCGHRGIIVAILAGDTASVSFAAVPIGTVLPICAKQIMATGTTATNLIGLT